MAKVIEGNKIRLDNVRLSFPDLFEAVQFDGKGPFNYGASFLVEPGSAEDKLINSTIAQVAKDKWGAKYEPILKAAKANPQKICYVDGSSKDYDGYEGSWALSAKRGVDKGRPGVYGKDKAPVVAEDGVVYAGCYVNAVVEFWAQDNGFGKAVRCTLVSVQFNGDGDAFSAGSKPTGDEFDDVSSGADADPLA